MKTTRNWPTLFYEDSRPKREITREEAIDHPLCGTIVWIGGDPKYWTAFIQAYSFTVLGPKMFWKRGPKSTLTYKEGKFYGSIAPFAPFMIKAFHLDWVDTNKWTHQILASRKDMWKSVISGKITNPEMLAKTYSRKYFGGAFSYRNLREYFKGCSPLGLSDLYYYTTNPDLALTKSLDDKFGQYTDLLRDIIQYCRRFNEKLNPLWSMKRLTEYHQDQIRRQEQKRIEAINPKPIAPPYASEGLELILDERTCYIEGMLQHNCVHSCYWNRVRRGEYLLAKGIVLGNRITLGIAPNYYPGYDGHACLGLEQVHTIYNGDPSEEVRQFCYEWIDNHHEELLDVMDAIKKKMLLPPPPQEIEIPF